MVTDDDRAFLAAFETCRIAAGDFTHRAHVRLAWVCLQLDAADAPRRVEDGLRRFTDHHGASAKYHVTLTRAWLHLIDAARVGDHAASRATLADRPIESFDTWIARHPALLAPGALAAFYSAERLASAEARTGWLGPDKAPLPGAPV